MSPRDSLTKTPSWCALIAGVCVDGAVSHTGSGQSRSRVARLVDETARPQGCRPSHLRYPDDLEAGRQVRVEVVDGELPARRLAGSSSGDPPPITAAMPARSRVHPGKSV